MESESKLMMKGIWRRCRVIPSRAMARGSREGKDNGSLSLHFRSRFSDMYRQGKTDDTRSII